MNNCINILKLFLHSTFAQLLVCFGTSPVSVCVGNLTWRGTPVVTAMTVIAANIDRALFMFWGCAKYGREIPSLTWD